MYMIVLLRLGKLLLGITPIRYLFGKELDKTLDTTRTQRMNIMTYIGKKSILLHWNHQRPPLFNLFKQIINETLRLEQRTCTLNNKGEVFQKTWQPFKD